ncbi:MAG: hypothetical protein AAF851_05790 [Myxococcota bacterium]
MKVLAEVLEVGERRGAPSVALMLEDGRRIDVEGLSEKQVQCWGRLVYRRVVIEIAEASP